MSLKGFHVFFVAVCLVFTLAFGVWGVRQWQETGDQRSLYLGLAGFLFGAVLLVYGPWMLKKLKNFSYV